MQTPISKAKLFMAFIENSPKNSVEFYVNGLGWLIVLKENIEMVSDNWFSSTKYGASTFETIDADGQLLRFTNIYTANASFVENNNNRKYNLLFDELNLFADRITAFH